MAEITVLRTLEATEIHLEAVIRHGDRAPGAPGRVRLLQEVQKRILEMGGSLRRAAPQGRPAVAPTGAEAELARSANPSSADALRPAFEDQYK